MPVLGYCGLTFLARSQSYKNRIEAGVVVKSNNLTVDLRIPKIDAVVKKGPVHWSLIIYSEMSVM